ncbi:Rab GTPase-binding effector protein 1 [Eumeta japonica]|uniref:Rab GTPase-binding effector protein 1 n=1 Tax=Eumeta variegata TaxID=151549 RepID=A0A4C1YNT1_EUMVA|nr:Rab GTPase-binding effector protein 1 [Eumeta japonica]
MRRMVDEKQELQSEVLGLRSQLQQLQTLSENQQHEIQSLQMLIHETVEASSTACSEEVRHVRARNVELEQQLNILAKQQATQDASLAPAALVHTVTRSIARKLGAEPEQEDNVKKGQEDAELLRSLVEPLEEEIKALKEKLRNSDNQLQNALANKKSSKGDKEDSKCDMCANYEKQLVAEQAQCENAKLQARNANRALKVASEELEAVRSLHDETVRAWRSERAASAAQLADLTQLVETAEGQIQVATEESGAASKRALERVTALTVHRQTLQEKLDSLERDNTMLVGKYMKTAAELHNEDINLPDTVEELQEYALRAREQLITACVGREEALRAAGEARAQALHHADAHQRLAADVAALQAKYAQLRQQMELAETEREQMNELGDKLRNSTTRIEHLEEEKCQIGHRVEAAFASWSPACAGPGPYHYLPMAYDLQKRLQQESAELRSRVLALQRDLDTSEKVQQDFVRLSQSLQVQLERIREADTEVRWQHEEDVTECPACRAHLPNNKRKMHCRHCGRIFCLSCVSHTVAAGPRRAPARVCSVCRTLLERHTAPFFSTDPPVAPD